MELGAPWHTLRVDDVMARLGTSAAGLTEAEARTRLAEVGPNEVAGTVGVSGWQILLSQFKNVLILILLAAPVAAAGNAMVGWRCWSLA